MCIPAQIICNCYSKVHVFDAFNVFMVSSLLGVWSIGLLDPFSCQLHHVAFDRLESHTPLPCPATQLINIPLKFHFVFFILNFTMANTIISKKFYFRLSIRWDVIYVQREQQGTKNGALGDARQNRSPVRFYSIYNNSLLELLSESWKGHERFRNGRKSTEDDSRDGRPCVVKITMKDITFWHV